MVKVGKAMNRLQWMVAGVLAVAIVGCASSASQPGSEPAASAIRAEKGTGTTMALTALRAENSPEPRLIAETDGRPAYTGYHPQPDVYVVDLLKTVKQSGLVLPTNLPDFMASIAAEEVLELGRPMTRITIRFREPVNAYASASGTGVTIGFEPPASSMAAAEPELLEIESPATETERIVTAAPVEEPAFVTEIIEEPAVVLEPPASTPATRVSTLRTTGSGPSLAIELEGDGRLDYKDFRLTNPLRLVFDIPGTTNKVRGSTFDLGDPFVRQVRVAQFKSAPAPVTRIVLDLDELVDYKVRQEGSRLVIFFGDAPAMVARATPIPAAAPETSWSPRPAATIADIGAVPPQGAPMETSVIRGPQSSPQTMPALSEARNVTQPRPAPDVVDAGQENVFLEDQGPEILGGAIQPGDSRTLSAGQRAYTGETIDLELNNADIKDVLRTFAQLTGLNIAIDPNVGGQVTVSFDDVPWDQALELILRQNGLTYTIDGNVMRVGTVERLAAEQVQNRRLQEEERLNVPLQTVIKRLSYAKSDTVAGLVEGLASPRGKIIVDARTNQLIITDVPEYIPVMLNLIENVDIPTPQVMIEARIVETTKLFSRSLGVNWGFSGALDPALGSGPGLVWPHRVGVIGGPFDFGEGNPIIDLSLDSVLGTFDLDLTLTAAENEGLARIISAPKVTTQDNQSAQIQSGLQIPFQTRVNFTTTVSFINATLMLTVTPQITAEDTVIMDIVVQKVDPLPGFDVTGATNPPLSTRSAQTRVMVRDGGTAVIGGIYTSTDNDAENRVPFVHDIPIVGYLFKSRVIQNRNDELLIFITPRIIRNI